MHASHRTHAGLVGALLRRHDGRDGLGVGPTPPHAQRDRRMLRLRRNLDARVLPSRGRGPQRQRGVPGVPAAVAVLGVQPDHTRVVAAVHGHRRLSPGNFTGDRKAKRKKAHRGPPLDAPQPPSHAFVPPVVVAAARSTAPPSPPLPPFPTPSSLSCPDSATSL